MLMFRSLGVSNFGIHQLEELKAAGCPTPVVNQVELHPFMRKNELVEYCRKNHIILMGYCPLVRSKKNDDPTLVDVARR